MSREKQIEEMAKALTKYEYSLCERLPKDKCLLASATHAQVSCDYCKIAEYLYNAGYRKQSEWISVEERLPNPGEEVLVCDETGDVYTDLIECDGKWNKEISRWWGIKYLYWMPLPEAPKMKGGAE